MTISLALSGPMALEGSGVVVGDSQLGGRQTRLLLAFLVLARRRAVPRAELAEVLWPEQLPTTWEPALRGILSKVRAVLAMVGLPSAEVLTVAFGCYQLHLPADAVVDIELSGLAVQSAELALGDGTLEEAIRHAVTALAIASQPVLAGEDADWIDRVRAQQLRRQLRALEILSEARSGLGEFALAVRAAADAVAIDPLRESAHRCLMRAYLASGNRGEALRAYERCRRILADDLGVRPSPETEAAYVGLLGAEPGAAAVSTGPAAAPPPFPEVLTRADPLVGRKSEVLRLLEAWRDAAAGRRQLVLLAGDAGMGKTALAAEAAMVAHFDGAAVLYGRCDKELLLPYDAFVEALTRYATTCDDDLLRAQRERAGPELARIVPEGAQPLGLAPPGLADPSETDRHGLLTAVAGFLGAIAATTPVVMVIEDLQWAGSSTLLLLRHLVRALELSPVLFLITYRDDEIDPGGAARNSLADLRREVAAHHLVLDGLDQAAVTELTAQIRGNKPDARWDAAARILRDQTGGNPFLVSELVRHLGETPGWLVDHEEDGTPLLSPRLPATVIQVIDRRRTRLSATANRILAIASAVGQEFGLDVVERVSGLTGDEPLDALDEAVDAKLICEVPGVVGTYRFSHGLVREAVYQEMGGTRRARLHARIGEAVEALRGEDDRGRLTELAHHLWLAGPMADPEKAIGYSVKAGDQAMEYLAYERAAVHFERALQMDDRHSGHEVRRCRLLMALATARRKAGRVASARDAYLGAAELARRLGDPEALAGCALGLAGGGRSVSAWIADEVRISLLEESLEALGETESDLRARVLADLADALHFSNQHHRRDELASRAVEMARDTDDPSVLVDALDASRVIVSGPTNTELRIAYADEMAALAERAQEPELMVRTRVSRLADAFEVADRPQVDEDLRSALELAKGLHQPYFLWRAITWEVPVAMAEGRFETAQSRAQDAAALWGTDDHPYALQCLSIQVAMLSLLQEGPSDVDAIRQVVETNPMVPSYRCLLAWMLAADGRISEATDEFEHFAADGFISPPLDSNWLFGAAALAETCVRLQDGARAGVLHQLLLPFADRMVVLEAMGGGGGFCGSVAHLLGILAAAMGDTGEAERRLKESIVANDRFGASFFATRSRSSLAQLRTQVGLRAGRGVPAASSAESGH